MNSSAHASALERSLTLLWHNSRAASGTGNSDCTKLNAFPPSPTIRARLPKEATFILISQDGIKVYPQRPLLFTPSPPVVHTQIPGAFDLWFINEMQHFR